MFHDLHKKGSLESVMVYFGFIFVHNTQQIVAGMNGNKKSITAYPTAYGLVIDCDHVFHDLQTI